MAVFLLPHGHSWDLARSNFILQYYVVWDLFTSFLKQTVLSFPEPVNHAHCYQCSALTSIGLHKLCWCTFCLLEYSGEYFLISILFYYYYVWNVYMCACVHTQKSYPASSFTVWMSLLLLHYKFKIWTACSKHFFSYSQVCMFQRFDWFRFGLALLNKIYFWSDSFSLHISFPQVLYEGVPDTCSVLFLW